jgi:hypothetical protein
MREPTGRRKHDWAIVPFVIIYGGLIGIGVAKGDILLTILITAILPLAMFIIMEAS